MASVSVKLTLFKMGLLMDGGEEQKDPSLKSVTHILHGSNLA